MNRISFIIFCFFGCQLQSNFLQDSLTQYRAHAAYQAQNFKTAQQEYTKLLQNTPYDAQKNYNLGVTLYKEKRFEESEKYFDRAIVHAQPNSILQEQALFNRANALVQQKKLQEAIQDYKKVLQINPKNENAQKNLKIVEQMLKEPPQEKDQNKQDKQDKKDQNKSDKNQQDQQNSGSDDSESDSSQADKSQRDKSQQEKNQTQQPKNSNNDSSKQQQGDQQNQQEQKDRAEDKKVDGLQKSKENKTNSGKQQTGQKAEDKQYESSLKKSDSKDSTESGKLGKEEQQQPLDDALAQQMQRGVQDDDRLQKRTVALLEKLDDYEKNIQKQLLQMNVTKQGVQQYGQKNW